MGRLGQLDVAEHNKNRIARVLMVQGQNFYALGCDKAGIKVAEGQHIELASIFNTRDDLERNLIEISASTSIRFDTALTAIHRLANPRSGPLWYIDGQRNESFKEIFLNHIFNSRRTLCLGCDYESRINAHQRCWCFSIYNFSRYE